MLKSHPPPPPKKMEGINFGEAEFSFVPRMRNFVTYLVKHHSLEYHITYELLKISSSQLRTQVLNFLKKHK